MKNWNFKAIGIGCSAALVLVMARLGVSLGRLLYSIHTGVNVVGGEEMPTWQELLFGDVFFYVGILALIGCVVSIVMCAKTK